ncbi:hypothetical protein U8607_16140 [Methylobacterium durans]|uniref:DUF1508 domain-containing protein n=1 Tax=Methylobacterium durans TaxID=2202825 RepID=A0A2U8W1L3_9HYPH|nr:hypothetical protein [Methylobacterium durans]AWN39973.1 hypothetical protein DK389_04715 [Methylobacterium durans]MEA1833614.1 hypothetical protein [Methylobacterium durans]
MSKDVPHPYSIEVEPLTKPEGQFGWLLRRSGKLIERSDRAYRSEEKAWEAALEAALRDSKPGAGMGRR